MKGEGLKKGDMGEEEMKAVSGTVRWKKRMVCRMFRGRVWIFARGAFVDPCVQRRCLTVISLKGDGNGLGKGI